MPRQKKAEPEVHIDDLHPVNDGFSHAYKASWTEQGITVHLTLDIVDRGHWRPGQYLKDAYELVSLNPEAVSGRPLGSVQEETAWVLLRKLRERMLDLMKIAGWSRVADTRDGQPIYQYRPAPRRSAETLPPAPAQPTISEQESGIVASDLEADIPAQGRQSRTRTVYTRTITFTCQWCHQEVTEQRFPSHTPLYCSKPACKKEATRRKTRERVAEWRKLHSGAREKKKA